MSSDSILKEIQLTNDASGHFLNQRQAFSPDNKSLVFDTSNDETKNGANAAFQMVEGLLPKPH